MKEPSSGAPTASPKTGAVGDKIILYIHGGAFVLCNHSTHRLITYELVRRTGRLFGAALLVARRRLALVRRHAHFARRVADVRRGD